MDPTSYAHHVEEVTRRVTDAITGNDLDMDEQTIRISVDTNGAAAAVYSPMRVGGGLYVPCPSPLGYR